MASKTFAENLKTKLDVGAIDTYFREDNSGKTLEILHTLRPEGAVYGDRFKLASIEGGAGKSTDFNLGNHQWGDWSNASSPRGNGLVGFVCATLKCTKAQAVSWLVERKFIDSKEVRKVLADAEGDPLVLPIPEDRADWEYVKAQSFLNKDRGLITGSWAYHDVDGTLLGYKCRVESPGGKLIYPLTYRAQSGWRKQGWAKKTVPLYGLQKLGKGPVVRVLFVEGEKTADAAQALLGDRWKVVAFSGVSASHDVWMPDTSIWSDCEVVLWPDNDSAGRDSMRRIQLQLQSLRNQPKEIRIVRIEDIPGLPPKWDLADWTPDCPVDYKMELERAEEVDNFDRICREYVYVTESDQFHNLVDRHLVYSPSAFDRRYAMYGDKTGSPSKKFLCTRETRKVDGLEFIPGGDTFVVSGQGKVFLNDWFATDTYGEACRIAENPLISDQQVADRCPHFREHVLRIADGAVAEPEIDKQTKQFIAGTEGRLISDALYTFFSNLMRRPMDKSGWVPTLLSASNGTGKSYFLFMVQAIFGGDRTAVVNVEQYLGQYHDWRDGVLFYELSEVKAHESAQTYDEIKKNHNHRPFQFNAGGDRLANTLKLNIKSRGMKTQRDFINGMVTANDLHPMVLGSTGDSTTDRRLFVIRCEQALSPEQADELYGELQTSAAWIGAWLMRFKPQFKWNPGWAPVTEHKRLMFEKDRERGEARSDKFELGKYDEFYHFVCYARNEKIGGFARQVVTGETIRAICEHKKIKFPYEEPRFDRILKRAGFHKGPVVKHDGAYKRCYALDESWLAKSDKEWLAELNRSINEAL